MKTTKNHLRKIMKISKTLEKNNENQAQAIEQLWKSIKLYKKIMQIRNKSLENYEAHLKYDEKLRGYLTRLGP